MNNITFFTHLKAQFHKKYHLSGDTKDIYFINKSTVGPLGKIDNVRFAVSLPMNGKVVKWDCSYKNEPMKNGVFNVTISSPNGYSWLDDITNSFVLSLTTSLNNLSIDTLLEGFNLAYDYYKSVRAESEQFVSTHINNEEMMNGFMADHISLTKDSTHQNKIFLADIDQLREILGCCHIFTGSKDADAYLDDYGTMIFDAVMAMNKHHRIALPKEYKTKAPSTEAEINAFFDEITK